jgi:hypothetical protein
LTNTPCRDAPADEERAGLLEIARDPHRRFVPDRDNPLLLPLPEGREVAGLEMQVLLAQRDELRDAQTGGVEQLDQRAVTHAPWRGGVGGPQQPLDVVARQELRQDLPRARRGQVERRILGEVLMQDEKSIKAADARDQPRHRPRRLALAHQRADVGFEFAPRQPLQGALLARGKGGEPGQVARVAFERMLGQPPLVPEMGQVLVHPRAHCLSL